MLSRPTLLFDLPQFTSPKMECGADVSTSIQLSESAGHRNYKAQANILLIYLLERIAGSAIAAPVLPRSGLSITKEAKRLLTVDCQASLTIAQLCHKLNQPISFKDSFQARAWDVHR